MKPPDTPDDESLRLDALHALGILDTHAEERFDRLTRMARRLFDVPIALVSLVDAKRQWFKSSAGLDVVETPREVSFCGHAILRDDVFVIGDASQDSRFADNPMVVGEPFIRFYAGRPLRALNGKKLGTLCIIDTKPRTLTADDRDSLKDLAAMVEHELAAIQLAQLDELTNIANRRGFLANAKISLNLCQRTKIPASLVFFDLDDFKPINDAHGHAEGDRALTAFAQCLSGTHRDSDLVGRLGGDEFVALLANTSVEQTQEVVHRLVTVVAQYNRQVRKGYDIGFSHGIVAFDPGRHKTVDSLLAEGDSLMYQIKQAKK